MAKSEIFKIQGNEEAWQKYREDGSEDGLLIIPVCMILKAIVEEKNINIWYAIIDGDLDIRNIEDQLSKDDKGKPIIKGEMCISMSELRGLAYFESAIFGGETSFWLAIFSGVAQFKSATFSDRAYFESATFSGEANFREATFNSRTNFADVKMEYLCNFSDVHINENTFRAFIVHYQPTYWTDLRISMLEKLPIVFWT